jgi:DNA processing protein
MAYVSELPPARARGVARQPGAGRYAPPAEQFTLSAAEVGFTDKRLVLKFPVLYAAGDRALLRQPAVAIVGSRKASGDGRKRAGELAAALARRGIVVMSGLAEGIDEAAHEAVIAAGGRTIGVIGTPLTSVYPAKHATLQRLIYSEHLLISPFPNGERTFPSHFPERNRVMARLSRATVIIEASDTSGALHQAVECEAAGRSLFIAKTVMENSALTWPKRFKTAIAFDQAEQVVAQIFG